MITDNRKQLISNNLSKDLLNYQLNKIAQIHGRLIKIRTRSIVSNKVLLQNTLIIVMLPTIFIIHLFRHLWINQTLLLRHLAASRNFFRIIRRLVLIRTWQMSQLKPLSPNSKISRIKTQTEKDSKNKQIT